MIFHDWTERALASIEKRLSKEDPDLTGRFAVFTRLARDEGPPPREEAGRDRSSTSPDRPDLDSVSLRAGQEHAGL
jgi:hypothetical protein